MRKIADRMSTSACRLRSWNCRNMASPLGTCRTSRLPNAKDCGSDIHLCMPSSPPELCPVIACPRGATRSDHYKMPCCEGDQQVGATGACAVENVILPYLE